MSFRAHPSAALAPRLTPPRAAALILLTAAAWLFVTLFASRNNSATFDEPVHTAAAIAAVHGDLSVNPEHPPLWKYIAGLPHLGTPQIDLSFEQMAAIRGDPTYQWQWTVHTLYREGARNGDADVRKSQYAMTLFGVALLFTAAGLSWWLAGPFAAVLATLLLALDPTLLAHGPIVSNDVAVSLMLLAVLFLSLRVARGAPLYLSAALGVLLGAAACTKYTGIIAIPLSALVLWTAPALEGTQAVLPVFRRKPLPPTVPPETEANPAHPRPNPQLQRLKPLLIALPVAYLTLWGIYGFRYAPSSEGAFIDTKATALRVAKLRQIAAGADLRDPPPPPDLPTKLLLTFERLHLLPQPMTAGMLLSYGVTRSNPAFALGQYSLRGWWWYFPVAIVLKSPLGLLVLWITAATLGFRERKRLASTSASLQPLALSAAFLLFISILTPLNIGVRHVLPVLVLSAPLTAILLATQWHLRFIRILTTVCLLATVAELAAGYPDYLSFFNQPARAVGPLKLLGDSNLDWGQDLKRLGQWRKAHPQGTLYLAYNGTADPRSYGLTGPNLPTTWYFAGTARPDPNDPDKLVAISATYLQTVPGDGSAPFFQQFKQAQPIAVIGRSIWIYRIP